MRGMSVRTCIRVCDSFTQTGNRTSVNTLPRTLPHVVLLSLQSLLRGPTSHVLPNLPPHSTPLVVPPIPLFSSIDLGRGQKKNKRGLQLLCHVLSRYGLWCLTCKVRKYEKDTDGTQGRSKRAGRNGRVGR